MIVYRVLNYKNAYNLLVESNPSLLEQIDRALSMSIVKKNKRPHKLINFSSNILTNFDWATKSYLSGDLGVFKLNCSVQDPKINLSYGETWLLKGLINGRKISPSHIPILLMPERGLLKKYGLEGRVQSFESMQRLIDAFSPLSIKNPFMVMEFREEDILFDKKIVDIECLSDIDEFKVIDTPLEFPPEYLQAGIGILNFFANYLRVEYPDQKATVRIEQYGLTVRMIITTDGQTQVVEKALKDFVMVITGTERADTIIKNKNLILELRSELRIFKARVDMQRDLIQSQSLTIEKAEYKEKQLLDIIAGSIEKTINVNVSPNFNNQISVEANPVISSAIGSLDDVIKLENLNAVTKSDLTELKKDLKKLECEKDPKTLIESNVLESYTAFIKMINDLETRTSKFLRTSKSGLDSIKKLTQNYNKVANWCGLPQVPNWLVKPD